MLKIRDIKNNKMEDVRIQFIKDLYQHMIQYNLDHIPFSDLINPTMKRIPPLDTSRYAGLSKPYIDHVKTFGKEMFMVEYEKNILISPIRISEHVQTRYAERNIRVTFSKKHEKADVGSALSSLDEYLSSSRFVSPIAAGASSAIGHGYSTYPVVTAMESSRKRSLEDNVLPEAKKAQQTPQSEISKVISMLQQIEELERIVQEKQIRKVHLQEKTRMQNEQIQALEEIQAKFSMRP